ncbi:MAG: hypothetical protein ABIG42_04345, partial [bacterium]
FQIGVYAAVPQLSIAFAQFFSIFLIEKTMARKKIILPAAIAQVLSLGLINLNLRRVNLIRIFLSPCQLHISRQTGSAFQHGTASLVT